MTTMFISGSRSITRLPGGFVYFLNSIIDTAPDINIVIGDASGVDLEVQRHLAARRKPKVQVYHVEGWKPRNNVGRWPTVGVGPASGAPNVSYTERDAAMSQAADVHLVLWDGSSKGSRNNILRAVTFAGMWGRVQPIFVYFALTDMLFNVENLDAYSFILKIVDFAKHFPTNAQAAFLYAKDQLHQWRTSPLYGLTPGPDGLLVGNYYGSDTSTWFQGAPLPDGLDLICPLVRTRDKAAE